MKEMKEKCLAGRDKTITKRAIHMIAPNGEITVTEI